MKPDKSTTPNRLLRKKREEKAFSQEQVAESIGASSFSIYRWERGLAFPTPYYRQKLCALFNATLAELGLVPPSAPHDVHNNSIPSPFFAAALPPQGTHISQLVGRENLLTDIKKLVVSKQNVSYTILYGLPGIGKTALALSVAHDAAIQAEFSDGILWIGVGRQPHILTLLGTWGRSLGLTNDDLARFNDNSSLGKAVQAAIGQRRILLIIDDVWHTKDALAFKVGGVHCAYLVTTRHPAIAYQLASNTALCVPELDEKSSFLLLQKLAPDTVTQYPEQVWMLSHHIGGLPLGLHLIGHYLHQQESSKQSRRISTALQHLQETKARLTLGGLVAPVDVPHYFDPSMPYTLQTVIQTSIEELQVTEWDLLKALAIFPPKPNTFSEEAAYMISGISNSEEFAKHVDALVDAGLVETKSPDRYQLHQTIADYAHLHADMSQNQAYFVAYLARYVHSHQYDYDAIDSEWINILHALQIGFAHQLWQDLIATVNNCMPYFLARGLYELASHHLTRGLEATQHVGNEVAECEILNHQGAVAEKRGEYGLAVDKATKALTSARKIDDKYQIAKACYLLGAVAYNHGESQQAEALLLEGLSIAQAQQYNETTTNLLITLGALLQRKGDEVRSQQYLVEGLTLSRAAGQQEWCIGFLMNLGTSAGRRGEMKEAETYLQEALLIARTLGYRERICLALTNLAVAALEQGDLFRARAYLLEGLNVARMIDKPERICGILINLCEVAVVERAYAEAEKYITEGLQIASTINHQERLCSLLHMGGLIACSQGKLEEARSYLEKGLYIARSIEHSRKIGEILYIWGEYYLQKQELEEANHAFSEAQQIGRACGSRDIEAKSLFGLARMTLLRGNHSQARDNGQQALVIFTAIQHRQKEEVQLWITSLT